MSIPIPESVEKPFRILGSEGLWKRGGVIVLGTALVIIGIVLAVAGSQAVKDAASFATSIASKGVIK